MNNIVCNRIFYKSIKLILFILILLIFILYSIRLMFNFYKTIGINNSSNNNIFLNNNLNNYQYFEFKINLENKLENKKTIETILKLKIKCWCLKQNWPNLFLDLYFKITNKNSIIYINKLYKKKIPKLNNEIIPYYIIYFKNENKLSCFLSHYYCDGQIFLDFLNTMLDNYQTIHFLKYNYIPILFDFRIIKYFLNSYRNKRYSNKKLLISNTANICVLKTKINNNNTKRYDVYAIIFYNLFKYISFNKLKVAFTVGIDDEHSNQNRIGVISKIIYRQSNIENYKKHLEKKLKNSLTEALITYDILNNFPVNLIRKGFNNDIDIVFTSFRYNSYELPNNNLLSFEFSSFLGSAKIPLYINSFTKTDEIITSFKISTPQFKLKPFLKDNNIKVLYTFTEKNKEISYFRKYNIYKEKFKKIRNKNKIKEKCKKNKFNF